jgi:hypothetical protein
MPPFLYQKRQDFTPHFILKMILLSAHILTGFFSLEGGPQGLKFYPGVGPEFYFGDNFDVGIAGNFGAEYSFNFPLTIGIDYRPGLMITDGFSGYSNNWGITARFRFISAN